MIGKDKEIERKERNIEMLGRKEKGRERERQREKKSLNAETSYNMYQRVLN